MRLSSLATALVAASINTFCSVAALAAGAEDTAPTSKLDLEAAEVANRLGTVANDGSFNYALPIKLPEGRHGVAPQIAIAYSSNAANGLLGVGWALSGLPAITRANFGTGVNYDGHDTYGFKPSMFDSGVNANQRLVAVGGAFHTVRESLNLFTPGGVCGDGPCYWTMQDKNGLT
jgi:hypothetical protein